MNTMIMQIDVENTFLFTIVIIRDASAGRNMWRKKLNICLFCWQIKHNVELDRYDVYCLINHRILNAIFMQQV